ncbi:MAG: hypothetical protein K2N36_03160 [Ruminiclostridium sp.]|nr:hypothetical protein [Ruminiclostridium sp.]
MKRSIKKIISAALALTICGTMTISMTGCSQGDAKQNKQIVASIKNPPEGYEKFFDITYGEWHGEYLLRLAAEGATETNDAAVAKELRERIIKYLAQEKIVLYLAKGMGISAETLTEEEIKTASDNADEDIRSWYKKYEARAISALGSDYTNEQLQKKEEELFNDFMKEVGLNSDIFYTWAVNNIIHDKYVQKASESITEKEINDFVQETMDTAKEKYEKDLAEFEQKYTAFYVPEGTRKVQQLAVLINSTTAAEVAAYRKDGDDKKADEILQEALAKVKFRIDEAYEKLEKGTAWKDVQKEYNDETSSNEVDFTVYPKSTTVLQKIIDAAMGIEKKGGYSDIFETDKGYFILYYVDDITLTDERKKDLTKQADEFLRDQKAYEPIADFLEKYDYTYEYDLLSIDDPASTTSVPVVAS